MRKDLTFALKIGGILEDQEGERVGTHVGKALSENLFLWSPNPMPISEGRFYPLWYDLSLLTHKKWMYLEKTRNYSGT